MVIIISLIASQYSILISVLKSTKALKRTKRLTSWDYAFPFFGIPSWMILAEYGVGNALSMANFAVEIFIVLLFSVVAPWLRYWLYNKNWQKRVNLTYLLTFSPIIFTLLLRISMPFLRE